MDALLQVEMIVGLVSLVLFSGAWEPTDAVVVICHGRCSSFHHHGIVMFFGSLA